MNTDTERSRSAASEMGELLTRLEWGLRAAEPSQDRTKWLRDELDRLEVLLRRCYGDEAHCMMYEELPLRQPRLARRIERLRKEHVVLLDWAHRLHAVSLLEPDPVLLATLATEARDLVSRVRAHELGEARLLQEAVDTDIGIVD